MTTRDLVLMALFAALTAALGLAPPLTLALVPVPITLQTLGVMLAGLVLGPRRGAGACLVLLVLVAAGLPVLAGGRGGLGVFAGPTAGFLLAWPVGAYVSGLLGRLGSGRGTPGPRAGAGRWTWLFLAALAGGVGAVYAGGIPWLGLVGGIGLRRAALGALVFVPGDLLKAALAATAALAVERAYPRLGR